MDEFEELLKNVTDADVAAKLKAEYAKVNQTKGEYGNKLIQKDREIKELGDKSKTYGEAYNTLKKLNVDPTQIPVMLEKLNFQKTQEEEYELTKEVLRTEQAEKAKLVKEVSKYKAEKAIKGFLDKERAEFKDDKGNPIKVVDRFIDFDKLYDVQDLTNETVLKEKCKQVLTEGFAKQTEIAREIGFLGVQTHKTPDGKQNLSTEGLSVKEVFEKHGAAAAIHAARLAQNK